MSENLTSTSIITESVKCVSTRKSLLQAANLPKIAADNVLQHSWRLLLNKLGDHIAEPRGYCVETLVCGADVVEPMII